MTTPRRFGRRHFLVSAGLLGSGAALGGTVAAAGTGSPSEPASPAAGSVAPVAFDGTHQPGITDRAPAHLRFLALDLTDPGRSALRSCLAELSAAGRAAMAGNWSAGTNNIADGLRPAELTVSIGVGASALSGAGLPVPAPLAPLPAFATDHLRADRSGGDLAVQVCGEDPMAIAGAVRALLRSTAGAATVRWTQNGFLRSRAGATDPDATPRNLMGQLDGTDNPTGSRQQLAVWVPAGVGPSWMTGGSYLVCRRIRMLLADWERLPVGSQEAVIGRRKDTGAPLTGHAEHDEPVFASTASGRPVIAEDAHIRLTHPSNNAGATMFRRGYSFDDGLDTTGQPDLGLFFQAFQTDPHRVFVPIQRVLAERDALNPFIRHEGSAVFAMPGGARPGGFVGQQLFE